MGLKPLGGKRREVQLNSVNTRERQAKLGKLHNCYRTGRGGVNLETTPFGPLVEYKPKEPRSVAKRTGVAVVSRHAYRYPTRCP